MLRNLLILPDGTELFSGAGTVNAIKSVTLTQCVNSDEELILGSTCANMLEATLFTPNGGLSLHDEDGAQSPEVTLYKVDDENNHHKVGVFILEKPTRTTANTMKITGYDRVTKLDKDLTDWLRSLTGWPYNILDFASMVCDACGLTFIRNNVTNSDYSFGKFSASGVTGRQLMKWIGEVTCSFCRANADGDIELGWYTPVTTHAIGYKSGQFDGTLYDKYTGALSFVSPDVEASDDGDGNVTLTSDQITVTDDGEGNVSILLDGTLEALTYFQNGLNYEDYTVLPVEAVQIQLTSGEDAYRWPTADDGANCYIFSGNPLFNSMSDETQAVLKNIESRLSMVSYTPCKVSIPANLHVNAGDTISITDKNGQQIMIYVMTAQTAGQKLTLECTGSRRRDSTTAQNNHSVQQVAQNAVNAQTQQDIFNKLTGNGEHNGLYMENGELYINADYIKSGKLIADLIQSGVITSKDGSLKINLDGNYIRSVDEASKTGLLIRNGYFDVYDSSNDNHHSRCGVGRFQNMYTGETFYCFSAWTLGNIGFEIIVRDHSVSIAAPSYDDPEEMVEKEVRWKSNGDGTYTLIGI